MGNNIRSLHKTIINRLGMQHRHWTFFCNKSIVIICLSVMFFFILYFKENGYGLEVWANKNLLWAMTRRPPWLDLFCNTIEVIAEKNEEK